MRSLSVVISSALAVATSCSDTTAACCTHASPPVAKGVLYVKTYKTASSSMAGLLYRYASEHNLTAWGGVFKHCNTRAIPKFDVITGHNYCGRRGCSDAQRQPGAACRGMGYQPWMEPKLSHRPFIHVVLVAEPCARLVSSYFYRRLQASNLARQQKPHVAEVTVSTGSPGVGALDAKAREEAEIMAYAAGAFAADRDAVQWHWLADGAADGTFEQVVGSVLPVFEVVGLTERFDESLILLARALGMLAGGNGGRDRDCSFRQLLYARLKDHQPGHRAGWADLTPATRTAVRAAVRASRDDAFYSAAAKRFAHDVAAGGAALQAEADAFARVHGALTAACDRELRAGGPAVGRSANNPRHVLRDPRLKCLLDKFDSGQRQ